MFFHFRGRPRSKIEFSGLLGRYFYFVVILRKYKKCHYGVNKNIWKKKTIATGIVQKKLKNFISIEIPLIFKLIKQKIRQSKDWKHWKKILMLKQWKSQNYIYAVLHDFSKCFRFWFRIDLLVTINVWLTEVILFLNKALGIETLKEFSNSIWLGKTYEF